MASQGLHQVQKQTQSLVLAPQLRQSLKILQVPTLELRNAILEELQANPTLEELPMEGVSLEAPTASNSESDSDGHSEDSSERGDSDSSSTSSNDNDNSKEIDISESDFSILSKLDEDFRDHFSQDGGQNVYTSDDAAKRQHFFDSLVSETSLQEHLMSQADLVDLEPDQREAMNYLIGSLDDRGFLTASYSDLALMANLPLRAMQEAGESLKSLDPPGIGCLDLKDCLLQQLKTKGRAESLASKIIKHHFELLLRRRIPDIARKIGAENEEIQRAIEEISGLDPAPGRKFCDDTNRVVVPDVTVEKEDDEWKIILNNDYIPKLRLSSTYKNIIATGKIPAKDKEYIREKMRSGKFLINSIEQRQQTIERITKEILKFQKDFFEEGISQLRPLTMNQVALEVGVHETTVSRAIANKYIETPHGVFEFKYFFTPGFKGGDGKSVSNTSIKDLISKIIEDENSAKPFSDKNIVEILAEKDIKIARRTVAKYREELGILPTNLRRRYT